jgi:heterodisulfide reductase subunit A-like polyferredoxin
MFAGTAVASRAQLTIPERKGAAQRILVVGGGLGGLCSAYELSRSAAGTICQQVYRRVALISGFG